MERQPACAPWHPLDRAAVRRSWAWRDEVTQQVINTDIDGLLTGALLHHLKGWPIAGFYDTETLWLAEEAEVPLDLRRTAWVDIDMCWPGTRSLSQHVITVDTGGADAVQAHTSTVNPNLFVGCHAGSTAVYQRKYPFGTFQWAAWIAGSPAPPELGEALMTGLAWMPDGGFKSVNHPSWRNNCLSWATHTLPGSLLSPLASASTRTAGSLVEAAAHRLAAVSPLPITWRNWQYSMSRVGAQSKILVDVATPAGLADVQAVLDRITTAYGWKPLPLPRMPQVFRGTWKSSSGEPPPGWPHIANDGGAVSMAITGRREYRWTEPDNARGMQPLRAALA
jgi:hypothetical protein